MRPAKSSAGSFVFLHGLEDRERERERERETEKERDRDKDSKLL